MSTNPENTHTSPSIGARDAHDGNRYKEDGYDVVWQYGDFDGFSDQKRCPDCGFTVARGNYGGHQCVALLERDAEVKRFDCDTSSGDAGCFGVMARSSDGEYVTFETFESVRQERDEALRGEERGYNNIAAIAESLGLTVWGEEEVVAAVKAMRQEADRLRAALEDLVYSVAGEQHAECEIEKQFGRRVARSVTAARAALNQSDAQ